MSLQKSRPKSLAQREEAFARVGRGELIEMLIALEDLLNDKESELMALKNAIAELKGFVICRNCGGVR